MCIFRSVGKEVFIKNKTVHTLMLLDGVLGSPEMGSVHCVEDVI